MTTTSRKPVSKRVRFAVFTRDNFTCQYCGAAGEGVQLTIDHVVPRALGGGNEPSNLVTACAPCNSGKTSTSPEEATVAAVDESAMRWAAAMRQAASETHAARAEQDAKLDMWLNRWNSWTTGNGHTIPLPQDWRNSLRAMLEAGGDLQVLIDLIDAAMRSKARDLWKYFCGCGWNHVRALQDRARQILDNPGEAALDDPAWSTDDVVRDAYWAGHVAGYNDGHEDGWESGLAAGRTEVQGRSTNDEPLSLAHILQPPKEE